MFLNKMKVATILILLVAVVRSAGVVSYPKLAAQPPNQQKPVTGMVPPTPQPSNEAIQKEAARLINLATAVVTPNEKLNAILDAANVDQKLKSLLKARLNAANTVVWGRWKEHCAGRGDVDHLIGSSRRLLDAERELSAKKADQIPAWESQLLRMEQLYVINLARYNEGKEIFDARWRRRIISIQDLKMAEYYRLDAEIELERAKAQVKGIADVDNVDHKMKTLMKDRVDAASTVLNGCWKEFSAGKSDDQTAQVLGREGTLANYFNSSRRLFEAERDLSSKTADHVAASESHRQRIHQAYLINLARYNAANIGIQDLALSDYYRLDAEIGLERAKAQVKGIVEGANVDHKMKSLLKDRVDAAKTEVKAYKREFMEGRGSLDTLLNSPRLLEAERDLSPRTPDQVAAWESYWQRMFEFYLVNLERFVYGRIAIQDLTLSDYYRLDAEIGLERAKAQLKQDQ